VRRKFGSALEAIRQERALSSKETVPVVSPALLVKFVIFVDIQDFTKKGPLPHWVFSVSALGSFLISILLPKAVQDVPKQRPSPAAARPPLAPSRFVSAAPFGAASARRIVSRREGLSPLRTSTREGDKFVRHFWHKDKF